MPFALDGDEQLIAQTVAQFAAGYGLDTAHDWDRNDTPSPAFAEAAGLGLLGMAGGVPPAAYALACLEMAKVCPSTAAMLASHTYATRLLEGHEARAAADAEPATALLVEEQSGSDTARIGTTAEADGDGWRLTGRKTWVVAAPVAKHFVVLAQAPDGPSLFHVAADAEGITVADAEALMGLRAAGIRTVYLQGTPATLIGESGTGLERARAERPWIKVGSAAAIVGATLGAHAASTEFANERVQFGKRIGEYQAVSDAVTEIDTQAAAARALVLEAASSLGSDGDAIRAAQAKAFANEMSIPMTRKALRIQGGTGFMREGGTERFCRDARSLWFFGETTQMHKQVLKERLLDA